jgi:hypothetical protein
MMLRKLKMNSDVDDCGGKKFKHGYDGACGRVWHRLRLVGVWTQAVGFMLVRLTGKYVITLYL